MNILEPNCGYEIDEIIYERYCPYGPRIQMDLQLVYVYQGGMTVSVNGKEYAVEEGDATLLLPGRTEFFRFAESGRTRHGWCVALRPSFSPKVVRFLSGLPACQPFSRPLRKLASMAIPLKNESNLGRIRYRNCLIQAMFHEFLSHTVCFESQRPPLHPAVAKACQFMDVAIETHLELGGIAQQAGVTPAHLIRLFRRQLGVTPMDYLWRTRTKTAADLLERTGLTAAEIAYRSGFANPQHFARVFKERTGRTPGTFRKSAWQLPPGQTHQNLSKESR